MAAKHVHAQMQTQNNINALLFGHCDSRGVDSRLRQADLIKTQMALCGMSIPFGLARREARRLSCVAASGWATGHPLAGTQGCSFRQMRLTAFQQRLGSRHGNSQAGVSPLVSHLDPDNSECACKKKKKKRKGSTRLSKRQRHGAHIAPADFDALAICTSCPRCQQKPGIGFQLEGWEVESHAATGASIR